MQTLKTNGQMYDSVDLGNVPRSGFDLSFKNKATGKIGRLIPSRCIEIMAGDKLAGQSSASVQFEPLAVPIISDMFVKQEHFYVPFNTIFENWDKFYTGGERLDYETPPPSVSMKRIFQQLPRIFHEFSFISTENDSTYTPQNTLGRPDWALSYPQVKDLFNVLISLRAQVIEEAKENDVLDLYDQFFAALDDLILFLRQKFEQFITSDSEGGSSSVVIPFLSGAPVVISDYDTLAGSIRYRLKSEHAWHEYEEDIMPAIYDLVKVFAGTDGRHYVYPLLDDGYTFLMKVYELYRPFMGVGSNLDYLGMGCLSPRDWLYCWYGVIYSKFYNGANKYMPAVVWQFYDFIDSQWNLISDKELNALPLRAAYSIWYNYYRDQLLELKAPEPNKGNDISAFELYNLLLPRLRCWAKDTFTTALDNFGTGNAVVPILQTSAATESNITFQSHQVTDSQLQEVQYNDLGLHTITFPNGEKFEIPTRFIRNLTALENQQDDAPALLSLANLEAAQRAQKFAQRVLLYGNRPQDFYWINFRVRHLDSRLRLPEYLSSSSKVVQLTTVVNNTTIASEKTIAGDKAAVAFAYDEGGEINRFCEENGLLFSYITIVPENSYAYGRHKLYHKLNRHDYALPLFATIGLDAVYDDEITSVATRLPIANGNTTNNPTIFGAQGRYYDNKSKQDEEHGELLTSQRMYTFARDFNMYDPDSRPKLNYMFVHCRPRLDMFVVDSPLADIFRLDIKHSLACERNLPVCSMYV